MDETTLVAIVLGILEGLTEFLPVSSTGHLLIVGHFLGFESAGNVFEIVIQLGAVLAILGLYAARLWEVLKAAPHDVQARRFVWAVLIAFLPAAVIGVLAHDFIKTVLFETPALIAVMLILGGVVLLLVDRWTPEPRFLDAMRIPVPVALKIGICQCLAMIPGVSRSGATIVAALLMGVGKRAAAEFSFFLSMPTMAGAVTYDLWKSRDALNAGDWEIIGLGFVCAAVTAALVVRWLLNYVARRGYALFGWWRIALGTVTLVALAAGP